MIETSKKCLGCGQILQNEHSDQPGYVQQLDQSYCQSCFRIRHYGDLQKVNPNKEYDEEILTLIQSKDALFVWVIDLFHLEESVPSALLRSFRGKEVILAVNKRDLFPKNISDHKLYLAITRYFSFSQIQLKGVCFIGNYGKDGQEALLEMIGSNRLNRDVYVCGCTNAGKSTLINALAKSDTLTASPIPSTTANTIAVGTSAGVLYDTPGFMGKISLYHALDKQQIKALQPTKTLKPLGFQLSCDQTLLIGGVGAIRFVGADHLSVICYLPPALNVMRIKSESLSKHKEARIQHELISFGSQEWKQQSWPGDSSFDFVLLNLGFLSIKGVCKQIITQFDPRVELVKREALI